MANRHTKGSVTSAVIRETKPRGDPPHEPTRGAGARKTDDSPSWQECRHTEGLVGCPRGRDAAKLLRRAARQGSQRCGTLACRASQRCHSEVSARERGKYGFRQRLGRECSQHHSSQWPKTNSKAHRFVSR